MEIQLGTEYVVKKPKIPFRAKLANRVRQTYRYDTAFWRSSIAGPWGAGIFVFSLSAMGMPTGFGALIDIMLFALAGTTAMYVISHVIAILLALTGLPVPRLFAGSAIFSWVASFVAFFIEDQDFIVAAYISIAIMVAGLLIGLSFGLLMNKRVNLYNKIGFVAVIFTACITIVLWPGKYENTAVIHMDSVDEMSSENPAENGPYKVQHFNYGSGNDVWQAEFGKRVDLVSDSVDASTYITKWSKFRTVYWGFNQAALPLNGRVWMPEGTGAFPLVLIVHGNHLMEDYSDDGYAYLGELLASRGFIAVSVDENFLNYSVWTGIPDNDMQTRAWILLKHLQQIDKFAVDPSTSFYNKVDFSQIGLIGHSRGGQAVAMAADYKHWFALDTTLADIDEFNIQAVAAIAPTDKKIDGKYTKLQDVNYLTLQGARDGDVKDFDGERQYARTTFTKNTTDFKASLYIADANHSQFNSGWGGHDISYPKGILLSRKGMLSAEEQRKIAKVYISAFLEATLHEQQQYLPLFHDYRTGLHWLPETSYFNRYESGQFVPWARFDEDANRMSIPQGGTAVGKEVKWKEEEAKNRSRSGKGTRGAVLERDGEETTASSYSISWKHAAPSGDEVTNSSKSQYLSFSLSDRSYELEAELETGINELSELDIDVEIESMDGVISHLPLSKFMSISPLPETRYTLLPWLDLNLSDGKYKDPTEAVFQTYMISLSSFTEANPAIDLSGGIKRLTFRINGGPGMIMLDDIGIHYN
ncbi:dienelactone hydrolase [Fontibacillus solani]|uniref:Dienelactone hydrolase n=1 Tax=Fontibacillus solani TaxID=1572857 RepID=A0A7W3STB1_9BACL|nr:alpha/beta hydrolase [Fontibacillus solani]MBA9085795.1 dienelactone hydrolase [Fontibacillus solani]